IRVFHVTGVQTCALPISASAATATVPAATAASRRGERTSGPGARRPPPATRSWTQASAPSTTSVRSTTDVAPPSSQPRSFHSTATGCSGLPSLMYGNGGESAWMTANATGSRTMAASTTSRAYWPTRPATRRAGERPATAAGGAPWIGPPITSSAGMLTTPSSGRAVAVAGAPGSAGIVDPPLEDGELQRGDDQRHEEQADRVDGADADVVGSVQAVDLEDQRLGGGDRPALGDDVDLGERLQ